MPEQLHLFDAYGVELEYMIVNRQTLDVLPVADELIRAECGSIQSEIQRGDIAWSNELVLHVIEFKTATPAPSLSGLATQFQQNVTHANTLLQPLDGLLMPSAMHPWMNPDQEMTLWPHDYSEVYEAFDRIFDCRGHGWANLQSVHLNLPFCGDDEFGRLHAAIRLILPLLPGLAAASPVLDSKLSGLMDSRMEVYRGNSRKVPAVAGLVIPEQAYSEAQYDSLIFQPLFQAIAPLDPDNVLQYEFLNARGAIARFGRGSIEIRVIDIQECPAADLAVLQATVAVLQALVAEQWSDTATQQGVSVERLHEIFLNTIRHAEQAVITDSDFLKLFGINQPSCTVNELWQQLMTSVSPAFDPQISAAISTILQRGPLARRIVDSLNISNGSPSASAESLRPQLRDIYKELTHCLAQGVCFQGMAR